MQLMITVNGEQMGLSVTELVGRVWSSHVDPMNMFPVTTTEAQSGYLHTNEMLQDKIVSVWRPGSDLFAPADLCFHAEI